MIRDYLANHVVLGPLAAEVRRVVRDPAGTAAIWRDYRGWRQQARFLRNHHYPAGSGRKVLVLSLSDDSIYRLKTEAMLALGLRLHGWHPAMMLGVRAHHMGKRYFEAFGIEDFIYFDDFRPSHMEREMCEHESAKFLSSELTFQGVKQWTFRDSWIGPQILSTLARMRYEGAPDVGDPAVRRSLRTLLPRTLERIVRAEKLFDAIRPDLVIVNEANYANFGPLVDVAIARNIDVIQAIQPWRDDALVFKRLTKETRRHHPASVSPETFARILQAPWTESEERELRQIFEDRYSGRWFLQSRNQPGAIRKERERLIEELRLDPGKRVAVVFSHILWDANLFYGEDLFEDYSDWFVQTVRAACANPSLNWIVKLHPANVWKRARENVEKEYAEETLIRREVGRLPDHVKLLPADTNISTRSLFEIADYGITVRGTPGMELSCFGVPVFTAGTGRYSGLGFTHDSESREEYLKKLARIQEYGPLGETEITLARKHAYAAFKLRLWPMKSFRATFGYRKQGVHPLDHNLVFNVRSMNEIERNKDLMKWAEWVDETRAVDYIHYENDNFRWADQARKNAMKLYPEDSATADPVRLTDTFR